MSLAIYQEKFSQLAVNSAQGKVRPHKMCMLLAVLDLAQAGGLVENRIFFLPPLIERYLRFFDAVKGPNTQAHAYYPFFHLRGNLQNGEPSFWQLQPLPGREAAVEALDGVRSSRQLTDNIAYAKIDEELFEIIQSPDAIDALGEAVTRHWFKKGLGELHAVMAISCEISRYEKRLRLGITTPNNELVLPDKKVRDPAFRRVVTQLYDYRCAATGIRLILVTGQALVEAAHILPFSESGDDDPRNGLPLTPNMHWAMDKHLIAPGPDYKWHVSNTLDDRMSDNAMLRELRGKPLSPPSEFLMRPKKEALEWRLERLLRRRD
jgi:putative restriction endonuclease